MSVLRCAILVVLVVLATSFAYAGDLSAKALVLVHSNGSWTVEAKIGLLSDEAVTCRARLEHWRNGELLQVVFDEEITSEPQADASCATCVSACTGTCTTLCNGKSTSGTCKSQGRCPGSTNQDCACDHTCGTGKKGLFTNPLFGDEFVLEIDSGEFSDSDPSNNVFRYVF